MTINRVTAEEYQKIFPSPYLVFDSVPFNELNRNKCDQVHYLLFKDGDKSRLGIILGESKDTLEAPFSSPCSMFVANKAVRVEYYDEAVVLLKKYGQTIDKPVRLVLPPTIYGSEMPKIYSALYRVGAKNEFVNLNYHYEIADFAQYEENLERNARKNLHQSFKNDLHFDVLSAENPYDVERVYAVIQQNRIERGFPLHMSLEDVKNTIKIIPADFFVVTHNGVDVAAAQVFYVAPQIADVIYWGDIPAYSHLRVMNYLTYKLFEYYYQKSPSIRILDIGISTDKSIPNYGLCEFKTSIGCKVSLKFSLIIE